MKCLPNSILCVTILAISALGIAPTTMPQQGTALDLRSVLEALESPDPAARAESQQALLGLSLADLPALRDLLAATRPHPPESLAPVRTAVLHVYAAAMPYSRAPDMSFLGVQLDRMAGAIGDEGVIGIRILGRQLGFQAFRYLRDGDVVTAVNAIRVGATDVDFSLRVRSHPPGTPITLTVMRDGRTFDVTFVADHRPDLEDLNTNQSFFTDRRTKAETYWDEEFLPAITGRVSPVTPAAQQTPAP